MQITKLQGQDQPGRLRKNLPRLSTVVRTFLPKLSSDKTNPRPSEHPKSDVAALEDSSKKWTVALYCRLQNIPIEILSLMVDEIDEVSALCLNNTNRYFRRNVAVTPVGQRSPCVRWLLMCHYETDPHMRRKKYACAFCKKAVPEKCFTKLSFKQVASDLPYCLDRSSIASEPTARFCSYHPPLTAWMIYHSTEHEKFTHKSSDMKWVETKHLRCMHCANAIDEKVDLRETGCENCCCDICPRRLSPAYIRYGPPANKLEYPRPPLLDLNVLITKHGRYVRERGSKSIVFPIQVSVADSNLRDTCCPSRARRKARERSIL